MARRGLCKWWRKKGKKKKKTPKQGAHSKKQKSKDNEGKPKGKCFTCGQKGY